MLSADPLSTNLIEFSKAAAGAVGGGYTPAEIRAAYGFNNVSFGSTTANGAGQTIAIVDAYNDPNIASDLATFDAQFGIAAPPSLKVVNQSGGANLPGTSSSGGWEVEESLDVEWAHAIAPDANIVLVEANNDSDSNLFAAVNYAREQAGVSVISMSWGSDDNASYASSDQALASEYLVTPSGHEGITFVAAAGDTGVAEFPSTSPDVLAVGGTDLYLNSNGTISKETYWTPETIDGVTYSGGGGVSHEFPGRIVPDVSYDAGVSYDVYDSFTGGGGWIDVGGTGAGSPQWAGLVAIADQGRVLSGQGTLNGATQTIAALHAASSSDFNTITGGTSETTGLGSPKANLLIPYLASYGTSGGTTTTTTTAPAAPASISATAASSTSVTVSWSASTGATGYDLYELENGQSVLVGTYATGTTSASVSGLSAGTTYSFQIAAYNSAGSNATSWTQVTTPAASVAVTAPQSFHVERDQQHDGCALVASSQRGHGLSGLRVERQFRGADQQPRGRQHLAQRERIGGWLNPIFLCLGLQRNLERINRLGERRHARGRHLNAQRARCYGDGHFEHRRQTFVDGFAGCNRLRDLLLERSAGRFARLRQFEHDFCQHQWHGTRNDLRFLGPGL